VSRIHDALERTQFGGGDVVPGAPSQTEFEPAWSTDAPADARTPPARRSPGTPAAGVKVNRDQGLVRLSSTWGERLAAGPHARPALVEQFRQLAGTLHHLQRTRRIRSVMVTSASPGDGKTLTAVNLALVLSESYRANVMLIDADLRNPSIPNFSSSVDGVTLSDALRSETDQRLALVQLTPNLTLLPAGAPIPNSIEALTSPRMRLILDEAVERYDWVILDASPIGPATDPRLLTSMVDGSLFVIRAGQTQFEDVQRGVEALGREHVLGIVLNGVEGNAFTAYYGAQPASGR
jgi:protein-tyrosine kinase